MIKIFLLLFSLNCFSQVYWRNNPTAPIGPPTTGPGTKTSSIPTPPAATGFGCGGAGAWWGGGNGSAGLYGGGGGGASSGTGSGANCYVGGAGGKGVVVIQYYSGSSIISSTIYANSGTFNITAGMTSMKVWAIGGGGAGGCCDANNKCSSGGGAAGGIAVVTKAVTGGNTVVVTIGAAGAACACGWNTGGSGGNTTVTLNGATIVVATGGGGSGKNIPGAAGTCTTCGDYSASGSRPYYPDQTASSDSSGGGAINGTGACLSYDGVVSDGGTGCQSQDLSGMFSAINLSRLTL